MYPGCAALPVPAFLPRLLPNLHLPTPLPPQAAIAPAAVATAAIEERSEAGEVDGCRGEIGEVDGCRGETGEIVEVV